MDRPIANERKRVDDDRQFPKKGNFSLKPGYKKKNPRKAHQQTDDTMLAVDKTPKPIPCYVLVKLRERISADKDQVKRYFQMIMSEQIDFDIRLLPEMVDNSSSESEVHLVFTSMNRARKAYTALQKLIKAKGSTIESVKVQKHSQSTDEKNDILFKCETEIQEKAVKLLEDHNEKLSAAVRLLDKVQIRKYVSLAEYERKTSEKEALQDKVSELENQMKQFKDFLKMTRHHLKEIQQSNSIQQEMVEIRKAFGRECHKFISALPMYARRGDILDIVMKNQVSVILGETGSGKSTQLVQYLHQRGLGKKGIIACTQPRKVAAISLARHVSSEMGCTIGEHVGYQVGMQTKKGENTSIMYMTDHVLLNDCLKDKLLKKYSCVIIDEAHERSIYTDLLIGIVKSCLKERPDFKVIITSATIDPEVFVKYFGGCPVLKVSGRMFPVDVVWKDTPRQTNADYVLEAVGKAIETHQTEDQGDILVFLTSPTETERACLLLEAKIPVPDEVNCLQLHGRLQCDEQQRVFEQTPPGKRKIVFATNSAETSITIPGIKYVIDTGLVKEVRYDPKKNRSSLDITTVNQSSAEQRRGRAGRISAGKCFRLYTKEEFESSEKISTPEILRVHVSGALLKLLEVGISNPLEFDYVQPPPMEALQYGMKSLRELEAVDDQGITEVGKQMAKLPLEPHLSRMVLYGIEEGIGFEVLVLAAVTSTSGSVFFRKGTEDEKEMADKLKTTFCHQAGDSITFVGAYREWDRVPDHQKNKWCVSNFINAKAMRFSRDTVQEMIKILKVELNLKVPYKFQPEEESLKRLPHIIFKTYARRHLCFFLGHDRAGYLIPQHGQIVQVHPSSALKYLGSTPKWLVYQSLLTTSQDFAMNLTPVEERFVVEATESGMLSLDLKLIEAQILRPFTIPLGSFLMKELIGPRYSMLNNIKREISAAIGEKTVIIDPKHATGELMVFCQIDGHQIASNFIIRWLESRREKLREETCELPLDSSPGSVRAILGQGGETKWILMPEQYMSVFVKVTEDREPQAQEIMEIFAKFGEIVSHFEFKVNKNAKYQSWGKITYKDPKCASEAVRKTSGQPISAAPENRLNVSSGSQEYRMRLKWCRRPSRGFGFVTFNGVEDCIMAISSTTRVHVGSTFAYLRPANGKDNEIFVHKLDRNVDEIQLQSALKDAFPTAVNIDRVNIVREKPSPTTEEQLSAFSHQISQQIETSLGIEKKLYEIELIKPKEKDFYFTAYLTFKSPDDGQAVHSSLRIAVGDKHVITEPLLSTSIRVLKEVYETSKTCIQAAIAGILERRMGKLDIKTKELPDGKRALYIRADNVGDLAEAKKVIHEITQGEVIDCSTGVKRILLSVSAKQQINQIMSSSETFIQVDSRQSILTIYGRERGRTLAKINLNKYLDEMVSQNIIDIPLRGDGKPVGLMKALMQTYGLDLQRLIQETGATRLKLELRRHILCFQGTSDALAKLEQALQTCINGLPDKQPNTENSVGCVVCFCPIDKIFRIECCGHPYCQECIKNQIRVAIEDKEFPITCAQEGCSVPIEWKTIKNQVSEPLLKSLVVSSTSAFVSKDLEAYAYCSTPDCPMVYQITDDGKPFMCSSCQVTTCTTCKIEYHIGLSCAMYQGMKRDKNISLKVWLEENPQNRRKCPECKTPIEKNGGCNHMTCLCCKKHICWSCNKTFSTSTECYDHLSHCGGIFPNNN